MSKYFALIFVDATQSWHPVVQPGYPAGDARLALGDSVLEVEGYVNDPEHVSSETRVFDITKHEAAVPRPEPGSTILVNGVYVKAS